MSGCSASKRGQRRRSVDRLHDQIAGLRQREADQRQSRSLSSSAMRIFMGLVAGGWWLVAGGWWLVAGRYRSSSSLKPQAQSSRSPGRCDHEARVRSSSRSRCKDLAAMPLDDRLHDPQPQPQAAGLGLGLRAAVKRSKMDPNSTSGNPGTFVLHPGVATRSPRASAPIRNRAVLRCVLAGIRQQVHEHLRQARPRRHRGGRSSGRSTSTYLPALHEQRTRSAPGILDDFC
jgi:hypothetical protein